MLEQPNQKMMEQFGVKAIFQFTQLNKERLTKLAQWVDQNNIRVNVDKTFPLEEAGKALDYQRCTSKRQSSLGDLKVRMRNGCQMIRF